jgi:hypothetical protein
MLTRLPHPFTKQETKMTYDRDPHLISVSTQAKDLQKQFDDIVWECGINDPRIAALAAEIRHYKELEAKGVIYEPRF